LGFSRNSKSIHEFPWGAVMHGVFDE